MRYAVVRIWKNDKNNFHIVEYVNSYKEGLNKIIFLPKSDLFDYEVHTYDLQN